MGISYFDLTYCSCVCGGTERRGRIMFMWYENIWWYVTCDQLYFRLKKKCSKSYGIWFFRFAQFSGLLVIWNGFLSHLLQRNVWYIKWINFSTLFWSFLSLLQSITVNPSPLNIYRVGINLINIERALSFSPLFGLFLSPSLSPSHLTCPPSIADY